jgi:hypothetical protein
VINGSFKSSVNFDFISILKEEDDIIRSYISVVNAQIPMSYYLITSTNNKLSYNTQSPIFIQDLYIPVGNYNSYTLCEKLISLFLAQGIIINITVSSINGLINFAQSSSIFLIYPYQVYPSNLIISSIAPLIGLTNTTIYSGTSITGNYPVNLLGTKRIKIKSSALAINSLSSVNSSYNNTIAIIPVDNSFFSLINYENKNELNKNIIKVSTIENLDIQLTDDDDNLINFNNFDWALTLCISIERKEKVKDNITLKDILKHTLILNTEDKMNLEVVEEKILTQDEKDLQLLQK